MNEPEEYYRAAGADDIHQIVSVHIEAFPGFFLTSLGHSFLETMYRAFLFAPGSTFVVHERDGTLDGFAIGLLGGEDGLLSAHNLPALLKALIRPVIANPGRIIRRIISQFLCRGGEPPVPEGVMVLRSIGVRSGTRSTGVASRLLERLELSALEKGAAAIALTTDTRDNEHALGFYRKHGYRVVREFRQNGNREMAMLHKPLR